MNRSLGVAVLILVTLALAPVEARRAEDKKDEKARPKLYKSPQKVFEAFVAAEEKTDRKAWVICLAPDSQKAFAALMATDVLRNRARVKDEKDAVMKALLVKVFAPVTEVLDRHGLTEKATRDVKLGKTSREEKEAQKALRALIKDPENFLIELFAALDKLDDRPKEKKKLRARLTAVKITGDKATGTVVSKKTVKDKGEVEVEDPADFVKVGGGWRLVLPMKEDEPKTEWAPSVELTARAGKWLLKEAKAEARLFTDRTEYYLTVVPEQMAGGTLVVRGSGEYGGWLPASSLNAKTDVTVFAVVRVQLGKQEKFSELAQSLLVKDGWKEVAGKIETSTPKNEDWVWKAFAIDVSKGEVDLRLSNLDWSKHATGIFFVVKARGEGGKGDEPKARAVKLGDLTEQFEEDEAAAKKRYQDKKLVVQCVIDRVNDKAGIVYARGHRRPYSLQGNLVNEIAAEAKKLKKGDEIVVEGTVTYNLKTVVMKVTKLEKAP